MVRYVTGLELRRRWRAVLLLTLLVAVVVGTVLASVAGARRSRTSFERFLTALAPADVMATGEPEVLDQLVDLPMVAAAPEIDLVAAFPAAESEEFFPMAASVDGLVPGSYLRTPVINGRLADPAEPLEVNVGERTAGRLDVRVGDTIPMLSLTPAATKALDGGGDLQPDGPAFELEVVGIVRDAGDIGSRGTDLSLTFLTPAFRERFPLTTIGTLGAGRLVVLDDGAELPSLSAAVAGEPLELDPSFSADVAARQADPTMAAIATALYVFAGVAALAGLATIGHAASRMQSAASRDDRTLAALGIGRSGRWARLVAPGWVAVALGVPLGLCLTVAASPLHPIGLARRAETDLGLDVDLPVLLAGGVACLIVGLAIVALLGAVSSRTALAGSRVHHANRLVDTASTTGAPPTVVTGLTMAFGSSSHGRSAAGPAVAGTTLGVLGVLAAIVFASSIDRLVATPALYGWGWDANLAGEDLSDLREGVGPVAALIDDPDVSVVAQIEMQLEATVDGRPVFLTSARDLKGHLPPVIVEGKEPTGADELALGRDTLDATGASVGSDVSVDLGAGAQRMVITGVVALPVSNDGGSSTFGGYLPGSAAEALQTSAHCEDGSSCYRNLAISVAQGASLAEVVARYDDPDGGVAVELPSPPGEVERLTAVEQLPWYLAGLLGLLAAVAVTYSAAVAVHRRQSDLAVLRVIGMSASQLRSVVAVQVLALTLTGALLGSVLGLLVGRQVWRRVVDSLALPFSPVAPSVATVLVPCGALLITQLAATFSRRVAGRTQPALALRAE